MAIAGYQLRIGIVRGRERHHETIRSRYVFAIGQLRGAHQHLNCLAGLWLMFPIHRGRLQMKCLRIDHVDAIQERRVVIAPEQRCDGGAGSGFLDAGDLNADQLVIGAQITALRSGITRCRGGAGTRESHL
jgi:hypothetical protein